MSYFKNVKNADEAKNLFRKLCLSLHPDKGGTDKDFIKMYNEYKCLKFDKNDFNKDSFYNLIKQFDCLHDITINFVGSWIWLEDEVKGATYNQREKIKSIKLEGFNSARFSKPKTAWYFSPVGYKKISRKKYDLNEIKNLFGTTSHVNKKKYIK